MKSYTDLEQSKKLAEILPLESADMEYLAIKENGALVGTVPFAKDDSEVEDSAYSYTYDRISCWSLAALLDVLPNNENISTNLSRGGYRISTLEYTNSWFVDYEDETDGLNNCVTSADNPVDACVTMIEKLNELNLL
jgi:hypothetical protein